MMGVHNTLEATLVLNALILSAAAGLASLTATAQPAAIPPAEIVHADQAPDPTQFAVVQLGETQLLPAGFDWGESGSGGEGAGSALFLHETAHASLSAEAGVPTGESGRAYGTVTLRKWFRVARDPQCCDDSATATITMRLRHAAEIAGNDYTVVLGAGIAEDNAQAPQRMWLNYFSAAPVPTGMDRPYAPGTDTAVLPSVTLQAGHTYCLTVNIAVLAEGGPSTGEAPASGADIVIAPDAFTIDDTFVTFLSGRLGEGVLA